MKLRNILLLVVLLSTSFTQFMFGQFESVKIIPENPTPDDNITVEYSGTFSYSGCSLGDYSISLQGTEIIATLKYNVGYAAALCSRVDTLTIGYLTKGNYLLITNTTDSRAYPYDVDTLYFTVGSVGVHEISKSQIMDLYPNPTSDLINIEFQLNNPETVSLTIYDLQSKAIATPTIGNKGQGKHKVTISTAHLPKGIYLVRMNAGKEIITRKIVRL